MTLLTGSLKADVKAKALEAIASGQAGVVVGTHALIQDAVSFADLGLVVIDEQHRFGVDQRGALEAKAGGRSPHVLLMTATPIPRTLGQVLYADLDVSDLRTPPAGRVRIRTGVKRPADLDGTWQKVREEAAAGPSARSWSCRSSRRAPTKATARSPPRARRSGSPALLDPLRVGHGPRPAEAGRTRRRDGPLPRRRARRPRRDDRRRGRGRRPGGDDDGHRGRRPVRARPAPPAPRSRRARAASNRSASSSPTRPTRSRTRAAAGGRRTRTTASPSPRRTSSCARRATSSVSPRAASRACASPRSRSPEHRELAVRARTHAEALSTRPGG